MRALVASCCAASTWCANPWPPSIRPGQPGCPLQVDLERALGRLRNAAAPPSAGLPSWALDAAQSKCAACGHVQPSVWHRAAGSCTCVPLSAACPMEGDAETRPARKHPACMLPCRRLGAMHSAIAAVRGAADALQALADDQEVQLGALPTGLLAEACGSVPAEAHPCWDALASMASALEETAQVCWRAACAHGDVQAGQRHQRLHLCLSRLQSWRAACRDRGLTASLQGPKGRSKGKAGKSATPIILSEEAVMEFASRQGGVLVPACQCHTAGHCLKQHRLQSGSACAAGW